MEKVQSLAEFLGTIDPLQPDVPATEAVNLTAERFCQGILDTIQYRESLLRRILLDKLPPAVECLLYYYAHGKPVERVEHTGKDGQPMETITEVRRVIIRVPHDDAPEQPAKVVH